MKRLFYIQIFVSVVFIIIIILNNIQSQNINYIGPDPALFACPPGYILMEDSCLPTP